MHDLVFVLEHTLGHVSHARNICRTLDAHADSVRATVIPIEYRLPSRVMGRVPGLRTWTFDASQRTRTQLRDRLRQGPVDAIFIHTQVAALLAGSIMRRVPTVVSLDATPVNFDSQGIAYGHSRSGAAAEALKVIANRHVFDRAAALVAWCRWTADSLESDYGVAPNKINVIHPGVDIQLFRARARERGRHPVRVLFVGGDFERKGGRDLLEAMQRVSTRAELDVVTGSEVNVSPSIVCRVHRGLQPQSAELVSLYREADVFVLPSRGDCFPQAVAEGLAAGLPIVGTAVGAIPEMIQHGVNGMIVPPRDPRALGEAIEALVTHSSRRLEYGIVSRALAEAEHDADLNNRRILELMAAISARRMTALLSA